MAAAALAAEPAPMKGGKGKARAAAATTNASATKAARPARQEGVGPISANLEGVSLGFRRSCERERVEFFVKLAPMGVGPVIGENKATPVSRLKVPEGFTAELIYSVPGGTQGSWVNLCVDPKGRIIASDQYGGLYRFTPPPPGQPLDPAKVAKVPVEIRAVNGLLWAFGALYVGVNDYDADMEYDFNTS